MIGAHTLVLGAQAAVPKSLEQGPAGTRVHPLRRAHNFVPFVGTSQSDKKQVWLRPTFLSLRPSSPRTSMVSEDSHSQHSQKERRASVGVAPGDAPVAIGFGASAHDPVANHALGYQADIVPDQDDGVTKIEALCKSDIAWDAQLISQTSSFPAGRFGSCTCRFPLESPAPARPC
jgi:hypothetical protein